MKLPFLGSMLVNGEMISTSNTFDVVNPSTLEVVGKAPNCSEAECDAAITAARQAFVGWQTVPLQERQEAILKISQIVKDHADELAHLVVVEQGKPLASAKGEVLGLCWLLDNAAKLDPQPEIYSETETRKIEVRRKPVGVIGCITAWNFPLFLAVQKWAPAIVLGNTCVWKPSPYTPLSPLRLAHLCQDVLPPGVLNVITASDDNDFNAGAFLCQHPAINKISFTGSGPTGKAIMKACADDVKRVNLELGGNDPAIVRHDVDVPETAKKVFQAAFGNTGQVCVAIKRVLVHESIAEEFQNELTKCAQAAKVGDGLQEGVQYGPLCNAMQLKKVEELVEDAKNNGATVLCGGQAPPAGGKGYFYSPTIVSGIQEGVRLWDEEQFGPVLPIASYSSDEEAVARANQSPYGLGGSVWSADVNKANDMAAQILSGTVWVNQHSDITGGPFGGFKQSGIGRELGKADLDAFTEIQTLSLAKLVK